MDETDSSEPLRVDLHLGDCLEVMQAMKPHSVSLVFCDLPYAITQCVWDVEIDLRKLWHNLSIVVANTGVLVATTDIRLAGRMLAAATMPFKYDLVLHKSRPVGFLNANKMPLRAHELMLVFGYRGHTYNVVKNITWRDRRASSFTRCKKTDVYGDAKMDVNYTYDKTRYPTSVVQPLSPAKERGLHPTQKPTSLLNWVLGAYSNIGDTILDPTAGSFTTAVSAIHNGRSCIAIEKDSTYFAAGVARVKAEIAASGANVDLRIHT
jgi:hypothetical protein